MNYCEMNLAIKLGHSIECYQHLKVSPALLQRLSFPPA